MCVTSGLVSWASTRRNVIDTSTSRGSLYRLGLRTVLAVTLAVGAGARARAATFIVTNLSDSGPGSLRQAVQSANLSTGPGNRVEFNIPGGGVQTVVLAPGSPLIISRSLLVDGFTQPGSKPNSLAEGIDAVPLIEVRGEVRVVADDCTVRGLVINNSGSTGLTIQGSGCMVEGCFIGTDATGTVGLGNDLEGVRVGGFRGERPNQIGGSTPAARNLISGNHLAGITVQSTAVPTIIQGNYIGTDVTGRRGIGNGGYGIRVLGTDGTNTATTIGGVSRGEGNRVAFNGSGVWVATGLHTRILGNSMSDNLSLGIDVGGLGSGAALEPDGETPNDAGDADTGANGLQNHPVITSVTAEGWGYGGARHPAQQGQRHLPPRVLRQPPSGPARFR